MSRENDDKSVTTALVRQSPSGDLLQPGSEITLPPALVSATRSYRAKARADRILGAYKDAWYRFASWCSRESREPLPASVDTVAAWMVALDDGHDGPPRSRSTINVYLSAVLSAHRAGPSFDQAPNHCRDLGWHQPGQSQDA